MSAFGVYLRMLLLLCVAIIAIIDADESLETKELELLTKVREVMARKVHPSVGRNFEIPKFKDEKQGHAMLNVLIKSMMKKDVHNEGHNDDVKNAEIKARYLELFQALEAYRIEKTGTLMKKESEYKTLVVLVQDACKKELGRTMQAAGIDPESRFFLFIQQLVIELIFDKALTGEERVESFFKCLIVIGALDEHKKAKSKPYLDCYASELAAMLNPKHKEYSHMAVSAHIFKLFDTLRANPTSNAIINQ